MITEKPTNFQKEDSQKKSEEIPEYIKNKIKYHFKTPYEKYCSPMTSSQEFGWDKSEKLNWNMRRHPKNSCDVTKYTDEYLALKGQSPYILKKAAVAEKQK